MSWTREDEAFLLLLHREANVLIGAYRRQYLEKNKLLCYYRIPTIVISSISGFIAVSNTGYVPKGHEKYVSLLVGILNLITSIINILENFKHISSDLFLADRLYHDLVQLSNDISFTLSLTINERNYKSGIDAVSKFYERFSSIVKDTSILKFEYDNFLELKKINSEAQLKEADVIGIEI